MGMSPRRVAHKIPLVFARRPVKEVQSTTRLLWITNHQAPYREPIWTRFAAICDLSVCFLFAKEPNRHWVYASSTAYSSELVSGRRLRLRSLLEDESSDPWALAFWFPLVRRVQAADVVLIGGWDQPAYLQAALLCKWLRTPCVGFYEGTLTSQKHPSGLIAAVRQWFFRMQDAVLAAGGDAKVLLQRMGVDESRVTKTVNAVDTDFYSAAQNLRVPETQRTHRYIYIGQLIPRKNVDGLLIAFSKLPSGATLTVVGDGEQAEVLRMLSTDLGLTQRVTFAGHLRAGDILSLFASHHTLVLPTHEDVWGMVVNEALAAGLNAVVSDKAGVISSLRSLPSVFECRPNPDSIASAMLASRDAWIGWRTPPDILSIDRVVRDVQAALEFALAAPRRQA